MAEFRVEISRASGSTKEYVVQAERPSAAEDAALKEAYNDNWDGARWSDYRVESIALLDGEESFEDETQAQSGAPDYDLYQFYDSDFCWIYAIASSEIKLIGQFYDDDADPDTAASIARSAIACVTGCSPRLFILNVSTILRKFYRQNWQVLGGESDSDIEVVGESVVLEWILKQGSFPLSEAVLQPE